MFTFVERRYIVYTVTHLAITLRLLRCMSQWESRDYFNWFLLSVMRIGWLLSYKLVPVCQLKFRINTLKASIMWTLPPRVGLLHTRGCQTFLYRRERRVHHRWTMFRVNEETKEEEKNKKGADIFTLVSLLLLLARLDSLITSLCKRPIWFIPRWRDGFPFFFFASLIS